MTMERDFVEAPSQMLEQWVWHYETLREFAVDEKGQPISPALVEKMNAAQHFGEAANTSAQIFYANLALNYHNRDPDTFELLPLQAISMDLFSRFQRNGLRDKATARDYREQVLAAAGSKPAADMVEAFLGRPFSPATYTRYLNRLKQGQAVPGIAQ